jgi:hypothetical protein
MCLGLAPRPPEGRLIAQFKTQKGEGYLTFAFSIYAIPGTPSGGVEGYFAKNGYL